MSTIARRRLVRDLKRLKTEVPEGISAFPKPENIMLWNAVIVGPGTYLSSPSHSLTTRLPTSRVVSSADTPFAGGTFRLIMTFEESYPNRPPQVKFVSRMFHPNVYNNGELCLDILQNRWSPTYDVMAILTSVQSLLNDPNPGSPANAEAAQLFRDNMKEYIRRVRLIVDESWVDDEDLEEIAEMEKPDDA